MRYDGRARALLGDAAACARRMGHSYVGSQHLLLGLARGKDLAGSLLRGAGADPETMENMALILYGAGTPGLPLPQGFSAQTQRIL